MPGPRKLVFDERFALSNDALKMKGIPSVVVMSRKRPATSITNASLSMTQGPAIKEKRTIGPDLEKPRASCRCAARPQRRPILPRRPDESGEQRMAVARSGGEFRVKLAGDEPGMTRISMNSTKPSAENPENVNPARDNSSSSDY